MGLFSFLFGKKDEVNPSTDQSRSDFSVPVLSQSKLLSSLSNGNAEASKLDIDKFFSMDEAQGTTWLKSKVEGYDFINALSWQLGFCSKLSHKVYGELLKLRQKDSPTEETPVTAGGYFLFNPTVGHHVDLIGTFFYQEQAQQALLKLGKPLAFITKVKIRKAVDAVYSPWTVMSTSGRIMKQCLFFEEAQRVAGKLKEETPGSDYYFSHLLPWAELEDPANEKVSGTPAG